VSEDKDQAQKKSWRDRFGRGKDKTPMSPGRRRFLLRAGVVALVVVVLVIIPGYFALQPQFVQRYSNLAPEYQTWSKSVHANVPCRSCHVPPGPIAQSAFAAKMLGEFYLSLVMPGRQPVLFGAPVNSACQSCHIDMRTVSPSGDLNIPHRAHVVVLKLECVQCHTYLVHKANPEGTHTPRMESCLKCHDGKRAKNGCSTCHTNKGLPISHRAADWVVIHPQMQTKIDCKQCHAWTPNWCADCHAKRPKSHGPDWRTKHGSAVATHRNCEACHEATFCIRCHGAVPQLNFNPALKLAK
jgi:hypothetical protein